MSLYEAKRNLHDAVYAFPSSVDQHHFNRARGKAIADPPLQAQIPHPRVGFFGVVDERMDLELVEATAKLRPTLQFIIIGPVVKIDPASLPQQPNLHWLGAQDYQQLPGFIAGWDVAFMPFARNESTRFISPTKTPEFLAAGLPVVSTPIADVVRPYGENGLVEIAATPEETAQAIDTCLQRPYGPWLRRVDAFLDGMSWDQTWQRMLTLMLPAGAAVPKRSQVAERSVAAAARQANV
jgi:glycosyltransferase involved in cell wall biosynthesis